MNRATMKKLAAVGVSVSFVALVLGIAGLVVPLWSSKVIEHGTAEVLVNKNIYIGLWHSCYKTVYEIKDDYECHGIINTYLDSDGLKAVQALTVIGLAFLCVVLVLLVIYLLCIDKVTRMSKVIGGLAFASGVFLLVGAIVYATYVRLDYKFDVLDLHSSFGLTVVTAILALFCGVISCIM